MHAERMDAQTEATGTVREHEHPEQHLASLGDHRGIIAARHQVAPLPRRNAVGLVGEDQLLEVGEG